MANEQLPLDDVLISECVDIIEAHRKENVKEDPETLKRHLEEFGDNFRKTSRAFVDQIHTLLTLIHEFDYGNATHEIGPGGMTSTPYRRRDGGPPKAGSD